LAVTQKAQDDAREVGALVFILAPSHVDQSHNVCWYKRTIHDRALTALNHSFDVAHRH
jgi:hypothetical protein